MRWGAWALLLLVQNFSFSVVSRARNSGSLGYHAVASVASNGVWIVSQMIIIDSITKALRPGTPISELVGIGGFYILFTVVGSLVGHKVSQDWFEKGKRKVGA